jgi:hypothetical protein
VWTRARWSGWVGWSWDITHADGSGRVYPNVADPDLDDWSPRTAGDNLPRLIAAERVWDSDLAVPLAAGPVMTGHAPAVLGCRAAAVWMRLANQAVHRVSRTMVVMNRTLEAVTAAGTDSA